MLATVLLPVPMPPVRPTRNMMVNGRRRSKARDPTRKCGKFLLPGGKPGPREGGRLTEEDKNRGLIQGQKDKGAPK